MADATADRLPGATLTFLADLAEHNDKAWFDANRDRFEREVREPVRAFVRGMGGRLAALSPHLVADDRKAGGSMTRLHRDVRFSKDKSPYHTHVGTHFRHGAGKKRELPGFFLRIAPDGLLAATGFYRPEPPRLAAIRDRIRDRPEEWWGAVRDEAFAHAWGELGGERLKRPPRGYDPDHPAVEDLKRKDFVAFADLPAAACTKPGFADDLAERWSASLPLMRFLCDAVGVPL